MTPPSGWNMAPEDASPRGFFPERVLSTGPLAINPVIQEFVGVLIENDGPRATTVGIRLFNKDVSPKALVVNVPVEIDPAGTVGIAFANPGFFYEAQVGLSRAEDVRVAVYGLTADFQPIAANTLHPRDLVRICAE